MNMNQTKTIQFNCGCYAPFELKGPKRLHFKKIMGISKYQSCPECFKRNQLKRSMPFILAIEKELDLPSLRGSIAQIEWARSIREKILLSFRDKFGPFVFSGHENDGLTDLGRRVFRALKMQDLATFWIGHRDKSVTDILLIVYRSYSYIDQDDFPTTTVLTVAPPPFFKDSHYLRKSA